LGEVVHDFLFLLRSFRDTFVSKFSNSKGLEYESLLNWFLQAQSLYRSGVGLHFRWLEELLEKVEELVDDLKNSCRVAP